MRLLLSNTTLITPADSHCSIVLTDIMTDPFEVRMRFTTQLQHLSAAVSSSQKVAQYALKYRDMDEDLHSCILEQLERVSKNCLLSPLSFGIGPNEFYLE
jgi:hypothetical protein